MLWADGQGGSAEVAGLLILKVVTGSEKWVLVAAAPDSVQVPSLGPRCRHCVPQFQQYCTGQKSCT